MAIDDAAAIGAVILAAGAGTRLGGVAKALLRARRPDVPRADRRDRARSAASPSVVVVVGPPYGDAMSRRTRAARRARVS